MSEPDFSIKRGDLSPPLRGYLTEAGGKPALISGDVTLRFSMRQKGSQTPKINRAAVTLLDGMDPKGAKFEYAWSAANTDTAGDFEGEIEVTYNPSTPKTFPNDGYLRIRVFEDVA